MMHDLTEIGLYREQGFFLRPGFLDPEELAILRSHAAEEFAQSGPRVVCESGTGVVRGIHGSHLFNDFFARLVRSPRLLQLAQHLLGGDVYVHQFKLNAKAALHGQAWDWHQDFFFWKREDAMPEPKAVSIAIFLDNVTEHNGPLLLIPRSHHRGVLAAEPAVEADTAGSWEATVSAKLKYQLPQRVLAELVQENGIASATGPAGTVLVFDPNMVHGSVGNISPFDRHLLILSYNLVSNRLGDVPTPRPTFLASRDFTALVTDSKDIFALSS